jgi:Icc-related predicted phosphoesterase
MAVNIIAFSDVHASQYLNLLIASLNKYTPKDVDFIVLAGDIVNRGRVELMDLTVETLKRFFPSIFKRPMVVAVFGNEEYMGTEEMYYSRYPQILWLNEASYTLTLNSLDLCFIGSRGVLKRPTTWQEKNVKNIQLIYANRLKSISNAIVKCRESGYYTILVTHYASSYLTVYGERTSIYPYLGYPLIEELAVKPNVSIHGHAHNALRLEASIEKTAVYNVSLPARRDVTFITLRP